MTEKKYRERAFLKKDSSQRMFSNFGLTFWRGEWTDLPKLTKAARIWLEKNEHIIIEKIQISDFTSDKGTRDIQLDVIPVMTEITLTRELKARDAYSPKMGMDEMRKTLIDHIRYEVGMTKTKPKKRKNEVEVTADDTTVEEDKTPDGPKPYTEEIVRGLSYPELKTAASTLGLSTKGKKAILLSRILEAL